MPYSHQFQGGYIAFNRPDFVDFFAEHHVQVPLAKGDAVFFNPALYHGAGSNVSAGTSQIRRIANLLQISSPFGRAMEALDRTAMVRAVYPALRAMKSAGRPQRELLNAVVATAEGYAFPTNLDSDQPIGSLAPPSQVDTVLVGVVVGEHLRGMKHELLRGVPDPVVGAGLAEVVPGRRARGMLCGDDGEERFARTVHHCGRESVLEDHHAGPVGQRLDQFGLQRPAVGRIDGGRRVNQHVASHISRQGVVGEIGVAKHLCAKVLEPAAALIDPRLVLRAQGCSHGR